MSTNHNYHKLREYNAQKYENFITILRGILINSPIKEFSFQRFYIGGTHLSLFSHINFSSYYFNSRNDLGKTFCETIKNLKDNEYHFFIWPTPDTDDVVFSNIYKFDIYGGLSIYKRINNYVDTFHFSGEANIDMTNFYINNKEFLVNVIHQFLYQGKDIININDSSILGRHTGQYILDKFNDHQHSKQNLSLNVNNRKILITSQEFKCLHLLAKGFSTKWIANQLGLSPRTVETHLNSIKLKCNIGCKDYMVDLFHKTLKRELV